MMRVCHLNTCPVGVATQDPRLREKFAGEPEHVVNFMRFIAQEVRELMAQLGFRTHRGNDRPRRPARSRARRSSTGRRRASTSATCCISRTSAPEVGRFCQIAQDHGLEKSLDVTQLLDICKPAIERGEKVTAELPIRNVNRVVGTITGSEITRKYGADGLPEDTIQHPLQGLGRPELRRVRAARHDARARRRRQRLRRQGPVGRQAHRLSAGRLDVRAEENIIIGNVALYGATSGEVYIRGMAGERFCVRNSGVHAVVEAVGDHGCEYMTGGRVVVLGPAGRNFAAGMSGGVAYVLDERGDFADSVQSSRWSASSRSKSRRRSPKCAR